MRQSTSVYLDLIRLGAALLVFVGHASMPFMAGERFVAITPYMGDAVMVFFVLSGFVIAYATEAKPGDARAYAIARLARIYSVALPAIALTLVLDGIGAGLRPEFYAAYAGNELADPLLHRLLPVFFLNQLWYSDFAVGTLGAYWSLCYEVWYYLGFGILVFSRGRLRLALLLALGLFIGPRIALYGVIWSLGVLAYRLCAADVIGERLGALLCALGLALLIGFAGWGVYGEDAAQRLLAPVLGESLIAHHLGVALAFALHLVGFNAVAGRLGAGFARVAGPLRWLSGATFTIYLFHLPVIVFLAAVLPLEPGSVTAAVVLLGGGLVLLLGIAELTERRKRPWQAAFTALLGRRAPHAPAGRPQSAIAP